MLAFAKDIFSITFLGRETKQKDKAKILQTNSTKENTLFLLSLWIQALHLPVLTLAVFHHQHFTLGPPLLLGKGLFLLLPSMLQISGRAFCVFFFYVHDIGSPIKWLGEGAK